MIAITLASLFLVVSLATALALADSWLRGRYAFAALKRERALVDAGFVPMAQAQELRLREPTFHSRAASRPYARRLPVRAPFAALDAA